MKRITEKILKGHVVRQPYALGSKSEHNAVCLRDVRGRSYRLRMLDGEPFSDARLDKLVGKTVLVSGEIVHGNTFFVSKWKELTGPI